MQFKSAKKLTLTQHGAKTYAKIGKKFTVSCHVGEKSNFTCETLFISDFCNNMDTHTWLKHI